MLKAFEQARDVVEQHVNDFPDSFPPVVLNISDGEPTDCGEPVRWDVIADVCDSIREIGTARAEPLICNIHLDPRGRDEPSVYPSSSPILDGHESGLWRISSDVPDFLEEFLPGSAEESTGNRRMFVFNSDLPTFADFLEFCTSKTNRTTQPRPSIFRSSDERTVIDVDYTEEE